jgi:hypothetical protein
MSTVRQRGTAVVVLHLLYCVCLSSVYRASTGSTQFPMVELVDLADYSQGVKNHNLYSPLHRESPLAMPFQISPDRILIHLDRRYRRLGCEEQHLILRVRQSNIPLARSHTLTHVRPPLRWQHQDPSMLPRATYLHRSLAPTRLAPLVRARCPVMVTRLIQRPAHHPPHLHPLLMNYWQ